MTQCQPALAPALMSNVVSLLPSSPAFVPITDSGDRHLRQDTLALSELKGFGSRCGRGLLSPLCQVPPTKEESNYHSSLPGFSFTPISGSEAVCQHTWTDFATHNCHLYLVPLDIPKRFMLHCRPSLIPACSFRVPEVT